METPPILVEQEKGNQNESRNSKKDNSFGVTIGFRRIWIVVMIFD